MNDSVDVVIEHLDGVLKDFGISEEDREDVRTRVEGLRDAVMDRLPQG
ncbi:MAG: hypothetical protein R3F20_10425 [Planctomycetota bacterium]